MDIKKVIALILVGGMVIGCVSAKKKSLNVLKDGGGVTKPEQQAETDKKNREQDVQWLQRPLDGGLMVTARKQDKKPDYLMNFDNIDVVRFIDVMMTEVFKSNYLVTESVKTLKKRFSIKMTSELTKADTFDLFRKIVNLFAIRIRKEGNVHIFERTTAPMEVLGGLFVYGREVPEYPGREDSDEITFLIPFYNIRINKLLPVIGKYLSPQSTVVPLDDLNVLLINGRLGEIRHALSLIGLLDRSQFKEKFIVMITPKYWGIGDFSDKLEELLAAEGIRVKSDAQSEGMVLIPIENLNSLMVISPVDEWAERVLYWLKELDIPEAAGEARKVYQYKLRNVEVASVEEVLKSYMKNIGIRDTTVDSSNRSRTEKRSSLSVGQKRALGATSTVIAVKETNSIVLIATPVEYQHYMDIIRRVDIPRNQVFVEVIVGEVSLEDKSELGVEFWMNHYLSRVEYGTKGGLGVYKGVNEDNSSIIPSGSNAFINGVLPGTQFEILLNALVSDNVINIISTPKITVLENEEAELSVGSDIPVIASESAWPGAYTSSEGQTGNSSAYMPFRSVNYISTGIILRVKPAILSNNNISLEIFQEISEAQENKISDISSPEILKRTVKTTLLVQEGQIAFLGGLIQKKKTKGESGIPLLSKIPLLGNLFKKSSKSERKTELVVFINAKVIRKHDEMRDIVEGIKKILSQDVFMEEK